MQTTGYFGKDGKPSIPDLAFGSTQEKRGETGGIAARMALRFVDRLTAEPEQPLLTLATHLEAMTGKTTADVTESSIAQTTVEAVLKHANTAVMAPLFWFILFGPVAVVLQRLTALLDRLWGHRSAQFAEFR